MAINDDLKDYTLCTVWSAEDEVYICSCKEFPSLRTHGASREEAIEQMRMVLRESIGWLNEEEYHERADDRQRAVGGNREKGIG